MNLETKKFNKKFRSGFFLRALVFVLVSLSLLAPTLLRIFQFDHLRQVSIQPSMISETEQVKVPIFYSVLNLPKLFKGKPVAYQVQYRKGPPDHFISQIEGQLDFNNQLILEGPKTPEPKIQRTEIKNCFLRSLSALPTWSCIQIRESLLDYWKKDLELQNPSEIYLEWFKVSDSSLSPEDQTQGVLIQAKEAQLSVHRWIIIQSNGTQQAIQLRSASHPEGDEALRITLNSLSSLRIYPDLRVGQELIDRTLSTVQLEKIKEEPNESLRLRKLIETQILLISKVSVDPSSLVAFFHLAGTSTLLLSETSPDPHFEGASLAQSNLKAAYLYARDISPSDPKTSQIQSLWLHHQ